MSGSCTCWCWSWRSMPDQAIALAVTGASGAIYATRTVAALLERRVRGDLIVSDYGRRLLRDELGDEASLDRFVAFLTGKYGPGVGAGTLTMHSNRDVWVPSSR